MNRQSISQPRTAPRVFGFLLIAVLLAGAAAGCSSAPAPVKGADAAQVLQSQVLAVTKAAAANDPVGTTLRLLDELAAKLNGAAMAGDVTFQRHQSIMSAIDALRTELTAHLPASPGPAPMAAAAAAPADVPADAVVPVVVAPAPFRAWTAPVAPAAQAPAPVVQAPAPQPPVVQPPAERPSPAPSPTRDHGKGSGKGNGKD